MGKEKTETSEELATNQKVACSSHAGRTTNSLNPEHVLPEDELIQFSDPLETASISNSSASKLTAELGPEMVRYGLIRRRVMRLRIPEEFLPHLLSAKLRIINLPPHTEFAAVWYDEAFGCFVVRIMHESFPVVIEGEEIPEFPAEIAHA